MLEIVFPVDNLSLSSDSSSTTVSVILDIGLDAQSHSDTDFVSSVQQAHSTHHHHEAKCLSIDEMETSRLIYEVTKEDLHETGWTWKVKISISRDSESEGNDDSHIMTPGPASKVILHVSDSESNPGSSAPKLESSSSSTQSIETIPYHGLLFDDVMKQEILDRLPESLPTLRRPLVDAEYMRRTKSSEDSMKKREGPGDSEL